MTRTEGGIFWGLPSPDPKIDEAIKAAELVVSRALEKGQREFIELIDDWCRGLEPFIERIEVRVAPLPEGILAHHTVVLKGGMRKEFTLKIDSFEEEI